MTADKSDGKFRQVKTSLAIRDIRHHLWLSRVSQSTQRLQAVEEYESRDTSIPDLPLRDSSPALLGVDVIVVESTIGLTSGKQNVKPYERKLQCKQWVQSTASGGL